MTSVLIVILNWNGLKDTIQCVESLRKQTFEDFEILVIDNGSRSDSAKGVKALEDEKVHVLLNDSNLGFAGGVNQGINYAINNDYKYVALFNNDAIADPNWIKTLFFEAEKRSASIVTGLLLRADGKMIDSTSEQYSVWGAPFPRGRDLSFEDAPDSGFVFGASGGASLYGTSLFKELGSFDKSFFAYYEDTDISFRAQLAGHKVYYTKDAIAYHEQGATSSKIPGFTVYQNFKNLPLLFWKNIPTKLLLKVGLRFLILYTLIFGNAIKNGSGWPALKGVFASIYYFWTSAFWKRFQIQHNKKVSADYIWSILYRDLPPEQTGMRKLRKILTGKD